MDHLIPWFVLKSVTGIGNLLFKRLISHFGTPQTVLQASAQELIQVEGITHHLTTAIQKQGISENVKKELDLVNRNEYRIVTLADSEYPSLLLQIPDPPPYLYVTGDLNNSTAKIAVVGSRHATSYGITTTQKLCRDLAANGLTVVSGMARGIDSAAHRGTIRGGGQTIAVLGSGLGRIYPAENRKLFHEIADNGAVISEFPVLAKPDAHHFPMRNRIISGMCLGTVVVEATRKSGSLITARLAVEQDREVFAVPGSVQSFKSMGTHHLIKQGAKLVEHVQDIIDEIAPIIQTPAQTISVAPNDIKAKVNRLSTEEKRVYQALEPYPTHIDELARQTSIESGKLSSILLKLELDDIIKQSPGKYFSTTL